MRGRQGHGPHSICLLNCAPISPAPPAGSKIVNRHRRDIGIPARLVINGRAQRSLCLAPVRVILCPARLWRQKIKSILNDDRPTQEIRKGFTTDALDFPLEFFSLFIPLRELYFFFSLSCSSSSGWQSANECHDHGRRSVRRLGLPFSYEAYKSFIQVHLKAFAGQKKREKLSNSFETSLKCLNCVEALSWI